MPFSFFGKNFIATSPSHQEGHTYMIHSAIEADRYSPSLTLAFKIARVFDVSIEEVFQYCNGESDDQ
jgi:putative transcriptional regulator